MGETLTQKVQKEGVLSEGTVREILCGLLPAIAHLHQQQIVHRDLKPDNIILRSVDRKPVLIDFGAVKETMGAIVNPQSNSSHSIVVGTPGYMPSEQLAGRPVYASDLYSLGMTAIYLLTGKQPQELDADLSTGEVLWQNYAPTASPGFIAVLNRAIHIHPQSRFATAQEMLTAVLTLVSSGTMPPASGSLQSPTIISAVQPSTASSNTQYIVPSGSSGANSQIMPAPVSASGEWKKAMIMGGMIGVSILAGALLLKGQIPGFSTETKTASSPSASSTPSVSPSSSPSVTPTPATQQPIATAPVPAQASVPALSQVAGTNATIVGEAGSTNIRSGPGTENSVLYQGYPGNRIRVLGVTRNSDGHPWYRVFLPNGGEGWLAGQLVEPDTVAQAPVQPQTSATNATIVGQSGSKNIRTGPGSNYSVQHIAYPGDRVRILDSSNDSGGYVWYKVYFPNSGADGWLAGQLVQRD